MLKSVLSSDAVLYASNPAEFVERAIAGQTPRDDIAVIVVNFAQTTMRWQFEAADSRSAYTMRDEYFRSLLRWSEADDDQLSVCGLIFAELIGNAVRHAAGPLSASLEVRGDAIVLHVIDEGPGFDFVPALPRNLWAESGRGLYLIQRLSRGVRAERLPGRGSHVAVTLPVECDHREMRPPHLYTLAHG